MTEEEEGQERVEQLKLKFKLKQEQEDIQNWHSDYLELMEYVKNTNHISRCAYAEGQRIF